MTGLATDRAAAFADLHRPGRPLILPNAWDAASAALVARAGAKAIATTSAGVSWAYGVPDGGHLDPTDVVTAAAGIVGAVDVPVSIDIEGGYSDVAQLVENLLGMGVVGINLEDSPGESGEVLRTASAQAARIALVRSTAQRAGIPLWINARTDTVLFGAVAREQQVVATLARARAYADAGADSLFVPGVSDPDVILALVEGPLPLNVMVGPGSPSVATLANLGVARISLGSAIAQGAYPVAARAAVAVLDHGDYRPLEGALDYGALNQLMTRPEGTTSDA